ncbi:MAG: hypothetical protein ACYCYO_22215 [Bacilli bacterium]
MRKVPLPFDPDDDASVAEYFDHHSGDELEWEEVEVEVVNPLEITSVSDEEFTKIRRRSEEVESKGLNIITVRLSDDDLEGLKDLASDQGVGHTTMARIAIHRYIAAARKAK